MQSRQQPPEQVGWDLGIVEQFVPADTKSSLHRCSLLSGFRSRLGSGDGVEFLASPSAAVFACAFAAGTVDEDAAHGRGRHAEEVLPIREPPLGLAVHQAEIGFVDQGRRLERVAGLFLRQPLGGEFAQLAVNQGQELLGSMRVALFDFGQDARNFTHGRHHGACNSRRSVPAQLRERVMEFLIFVRV
jgi:hypothetical protein